MFTLSESLAFFLHKDILLLSHDAWYPIIGRDKSWPIPIKTPPLTMAYLHMRHFEPLLRKSILFKNECKGCVFRGNSLKEHIAQTKLPCRLFYSMDEFEALNYVETGPTPALQGSVDTINEKDASSSISCGPVLN